MSFYFGNRRFAPSPAFVAMVLFLICLWVAGGASRSDAWGQVFVRAFSWLFLGALVLFGSMPQAWRGRPVFFLLLAAVILAVVQLVPLPPAIWGQLPGREVFGPAADAAQATSWRPIAIVPSSALNAVYALVVPVVAYLLMAGSRRSEDGGLVMLLMGMVFATMMLGLMQMAGFSFSNPFVNGNGLAAGTFANRNHFALFLAFGCLLAPVWAFDGRSRINWRAFAALATIPLFLLTILASGSRAGLVVGVIALFGGLAVVWGSARTAVRGYSRWAAPILVACFLLLIALLVLLSVGENRASSISRVLALDVEGDMRKRALPTVLTMIREYFPLGSGFGGFDTLFQMHEPDALLKPTYFNRVHDDLLEVVLDGGLAAGLLLGAGMIWWLWASVRAWRSKSGDMLPKLGSLMVLLIVVASAFDYPARTPVIMALLVVAAVWLSGPFASRQGAPLRRSN
ncbi:O-antigen ligase family protein [Sphingomonas sp. JC676]|uniref:O-antigen ligase family protein n=1 Tax=Sphingomonas sp. JC676 TaxID=2768065 RepID=UPI0016579C36|nr:O-antigen ligase family protein [Sphingomonas sp. JC676]MBC9030957.1 O-antigen ligase family protein [Sphingomonas sp. JC676]